MKIPYWPLLVGPLLLYGLGIALNAIVMGVNGAQMPVLVPSGDCSLIASDDLLHSCMDAHTHLKFLADWITIPHIGQASIGDFLIEAYYTTHEIAFYVWLALVIREAQPKKITESWPSGHGV